MRIDTGSEVTVIPNIFWEPNGKPKYTDLIEPFARKKNVEFIWSEKPQKPFDSLKVIMAKKPVVKVFDPKKAITLTTDASEHSISGMLSQEGHPIMYLNTEFNYSNIAKEALAFVWNNHNSPTIFNWKKFLLRSDHRSLKFIINPRKG